MCVGNPMDSFHIIPNQLIKCLCVVTRKLHLMSEFEIGSLVNSDRFVGKLSPLVRETALYMYLQIYK